MPLPVAQDPASTAAETSASAWFVPFACGAAVLAFSWYSLWFLCDDAYIAFRYVGNVHDGHGLVWNPAPFAPVEGYSCFLWVVLLWFTWALTGLEPPITANWLALAFALGTCWQIARGLQRRRQGPVCAPWLAALALIGTATNVTFVTWASSGLETAMFGFFAVSWTFAAVSSRGLGWLSLFAALAQLTRPDGGLLVLATIAIALHAVIVRRQSVASVVRASIALFAPVLHLAWRLAYYGEWLPNTYYAKVVEAWPESGLRYLYCFVLEHGLVVWLPLAVVWLAIQARRPGALRRLVNERFAALVAVSTWLAFVGYYTLVVGGDHFAFRPFAHLVPLLFASVVVMASTRRWSRWAAAGLLLLFVAAGNSFGWWYESALDGREKDGFVRASTALPSWFVPWSRSWDRHRAWLRLHYVALPRGLHAATCDDLVELLPERRAGQVEGLAGRRGIYRTVAAGVVGWSLADVAIVDAVGLNDWVVARNPSPPASLTIAPEALAGAFTLFDADHNGRLDAAEIGVLASGLDLGNVTGVLISRAAWGELLLALSDEDGDGLDQGEFGAASEQLRDARHMAHERTPPAGYIEALRPNVVLDGDRFLAARGVKPLTDDEVVEVEREYRARVRK